MTDGYGSWWNIGIAEVTETEEGKKAAEEVFRAREAARQY